MPTDISVAIAGRRGRRSSTARQELVVLAAPTALAILVCALAVRSPLMAAALILLGSQ